MDSNKHVKKYNTYPTVKMEQSASAVIVAMTMKRSVRKDANLAAKKEQTTALSTLTQKCSL